MGKSRSILAIRFSAFGDVAMTIPVMRQVLEANPDLHIVLVTNKNWGALCDGIPRLEFFPADLKGLHKGIPGLFRLFRSIRAAHKISAVADLHQVLRSRILRTFFRAIFLPIAVIDKGRAGKKALTRKENKILQPLKTTIERYRDVFKSLGYPPSDHIPQREQHLTGRKVIGIAPFATYREKTYPLEKMEQVIATLHGKADIKLFGGGKQEVEALTGLATKYPGIEVIAGRFGLTEELAIIRELDCMISMDSANMHLASLFGVPVVSIWGATHPYAGFMGFGQPAENAVQIDLYCRPCSVFGSKPCFRGDHACMEQLAPERVIDKVEEVLGKL